MTSTLGDAVAFSLLLLLYIGVEPWDYHQYKLKTNKGGRGKQKAKIWIYYALIYGPLIHSRLGQ